MGMDKETYAWRGPSFLGHGIGQNSVSKEVGEWFDRGR